MRLAQKAANYILPSFVTTLILWNLRFNLRDRLYALTTIRVLEGVFKILFIVDGWLYRTQNRPIWAAVYSAVSLSMMLSNLVIYLRLVTHRPPSPPRTLPEELTQKNIIFECINESGELPPCHKDNCNGRLKTPRTHHCSVCGDCRVGFDHHCPWIGNCVTIEARKGFLAFLALTSVTVPWAVAGMWDPHTRRVWWDNWYSWVVVGGPPGRWIVGLFLGLRITRRPSSELHRLGDMIRYPSVSLVVIAGCGALFALFTTVLVLTTINDVLKGRTSLDAIAQRTGSRKGTLVWIPWKEINQDEDGGTVVATNARIYDAGPRCNWDALWNSDVLVRSGTWRQGREDVAHSVASPSLVSLRALAMAHTNRSIADS